jgi:hypothetical protein
MKGVAGCLVKAKREKEKMKIRDGIDSAADSIDLLTGGNSAVDKTCKSWQPINVRHLSSSASGIELPNRRDISERASEKSLLSLTDDYTLIRFVIHEQFTEQSFMSHCLTLALGMVRDSFERLPRSAKQNMLDMLLLVPLVVA